MNTALTIAGLDPSGGAGIAADLKTFCAHKIYGECIVTAHTVQNTTGVFGVEAVRAALVQRALEAVFDDIVPDAVKIGMVGEAAREIAAVLESRGAKNVVLDPLMLSSSGAPLVTEAARRDIEAHLFPLCTLITPNLHEAEALCGFSIESEADAKRAAQQLSEKYGTAVLVKGGHLRGAAADWLCESGALHRFSAPRVENPNAHGTGCTLSAAIAANLAMGRSLTESVARAKAYLTGALMAKLNLGKGAGPLDHLYAFPRVDFTADA